MKRRDFLSRVILGGALVAASGLWNQVQAGVIWVKEKKLNYVEKAPANMVTAKKNCATCGYFLADGKEKGAGQCTFAGMKSAMGTKDPVYVKEGGFCPMWKKKA